MLSINFRGAEIVKAPSKTDETKVPHRIAGTYEGSKAPVPHRTAGTYEVKGQTQINENVTEKLKRTVRK